MKNIYTDLRRTLDTLDTIDTIDIVGCYDSSGTNAPEARHPNPGKEEPR